MYNVSKCPDCGRIIEDGNRISGYQGLTYQWCDQCKQKSQKEEESFKTKSQCPYAFIDEDFDPAENFAQEFKMSHEEEDRIDKLEKRIESLEEKIIPKPTEGYYILYFIDEPFKGNRHTYDTMEEVRDTLEKLDYDGAYTITDVSAGTFVEYEVCQPINLKQE